MSTTITEAHIGRKATFKGGKGIIRYVGETEFAEGVWVGIELAGPKGKNDGSVKGKRYFEVKKNHGSFVRLGGVALSAPAKKDPKKGGKKLAKKGSKKTLTKGAKKTGAAAAAPAKAGAKKARTTATKKAGAGTKKTAKKTSKGGASAAKKPSGPKSKRPTTKKPTAKAGGAKKAASPKKATGAGKKPPTGKKGAAAKPKTKKPLTPAERKKRMAALRTANAKTRKATGKRTTTTGKKVGTKKKAGAAKGSAKGAVKGKTGKKVAKAGAGKKKKPVTKGAGKKKKAPAGKKKATPASPDAADVTETGEDLRSRILARLQKDGVDFANNDDDDATDEAEGETDQKNLAEKIQERLANLHKAVSTPTAEETPEKGEGGEEGDADDDGTAMPPPVAAATPQKKDTVFWVKKIQAHFRGMLIRTEQLNLLEASVKLLVVKDQQWTVLGQGTATVEAGVKDPWVTVSGWLLSKRAWASNRELLLEQNIDWINGPTCETDDVGPPIFVLEESDDNEIYGLEFALRGDEAEFEHEYDLARQDAGAIRIQAVVRGALARWKLHGHPGGDEPALPEAISTPEHHPKIGSSIKIIKGIGLFKRKKVGKLIDFNTFTGQFKVEFDGGKSFKWYDLDKTNYHRLGGEAVASAPKEAPAAAASAEPSATEEPDKVESQEGDGDEAEGDDDAPAL